MAKKSQAGKQTGRQAGRQTEKWKGGMKLNSIIAGLIVLVLYIGVHIISRTDGFRAWIAEKLSNKVRQTVAIEECSVTPLLGLQFKEVSFADVEMPDVKVSFNWLVWLPKSQPLIRRLQVNELQIRFRRIPATGNWTPLVLHDLGCSLGAVLGVSPSKLETTEERPQFSKKVINNKTLLQLNHAQMSWTDEKGRELAYISDTDFNVKSITMTGRKAVQSIAEFGHVRLATGKLLRDLRIETLSAVGSEVVVILELTSARGTYPEFATQDLWQDLNGQLNTLSNL